MKDSTARTLSELRQFREWVRQEKARGASDAVRDAILERLQTEDNPNSWLQGPAARYFDAGGAPDYSKIEVARGDIEQLGVDRHERLTKM